MDSASMLETWQLDLGQVRERLYVAPHARERERWHALWLLGRGWTQVEIARALDRDAHPSGDWLEAFRQQGPAGFAVTVSGGAPRPRPN